MRNAGARLLGRVIPAADLHGAFQPAPGAVSARVEDADEERRSAVP